MFSQSKDCQHLMSIKKGLKHLNPTNLSFQEGTKMYINNSLCPYYRELWNECKKLWNNNKIYSSFTVNGAARIKQVRNGPYKSITHVINLRALFCEVQTEQFRYLQAVLSVSKLCSFIFLFSICVLYLAIFWK